MEQINCSDCQKKECPSRLEGALCSENKELMHLIKTFESRDAILVSRKVLAILATEENRYKIAVANERIGEDDAEIIVDKNGDEHTTYKTREPNPDITGMAKNLIGSAVKIHQMINPPKVVPMFQQNNQFNIGGGIVNEIEALPDEERVLAIKFIDEKLNAS